MTTEEAKELGKTWTKIYCGGITPQGAADVAWTKDGITIKDSDIEDKVKMIKGSPDPFHALELLEEIYKQRINEH